MKRALFILVATAFLTESVLAQSQPSELTIKLSLSQWNVVMQALGEVPFKTAQPIIANIQEQAKTQLPPPEPKDEKAKK